MIEAHILSVDITTYLKGLERLDEKEESCKLTCDRAFHIHQVRFRGQHLRCMLKDVERLLFSQPPFSEEMLLEKERIW